MTTLRSRAYLLLIALVLLTAAGLRFADLHRYPTGPHYDEAVKLLVGRSIAFDGGAYFPMVEAYQGREALYFYLAAPMLALIHDGPFSLRVLSAFLNLITVAAAIAWGRALLPGRRGLILGVAIGVMMAVSFHQVWLSRQIFRAVALPLMQALALALLFRGLKRPTWARALPWLIAGGAFAGGALYTYNASRLFPLWFGAGLLVWWAASGFTRSALARVLAAGAAMTVAATPMIAYALAKPDIFFGRLAEVTRPEQSVSLLESAWLHVRMFAIEGDPYFRYNIAGRPYFTPIEGVLLLIGLAAALALLLRRARPPVTRAGAALALLAPLMVIPSVISVGGLPPSHMRSLGMVPPIFALAGLGAVAVAEWSARRTRRPGLILGVLALFALALGATATGAAYFGWASSAAVFYETDADLAAAAAWAKANAEPGERIYVAARDKGHPTVIAAGLAPITWLGTDSLVLPPPGESGLYLFPRSAPPQGPFLSALAPGRISTGLPLAPDGRTAFEAFRVRGAESASDGAANAHLRFLRMEAPPMAAGASAAVTTTWAVLRPPAAADLTPILQLEDAAGIGYARAEAYMAGTDAWRPGEVLMQQVTLTVPPLTPPGVYRARLAWVARTAEAYAPYLNADGTQAGIWADLGPITVGRPSSAPAAPTPPIARDEPLAAGLRLFGTSALPAQIDQGAVLAFTLFVGVEGADPLGANAAADIDFALTPAGQADPPRASDTIGQGRLSLSGWQPGDVWAPQFRVRVLPQAPPGQADLWAALAGSPPVRVGRVTIAAVARAFTAPPFAMPLDARFGGQIALIGVSAARDQADLLVTPVWQAVAAPERDYTFFVHLVDASGAIIAQADATPQGGARPTSGWLPGEVVSETIRLAGAEAGASLRLGWYDAETGVRLQAQGANVHLDNYAIFDYLQRQ